MPRGYDLGLIKSVNYANIKMESVEEAFKFLKYKIDVVEIALRRKNFKTADLIWTSTCSMCHTFAHQCPICPIFKFFQTSCVRTTLYLNIRGSMKLSDGDASLMFLEKIREVIDKIEKSWKEL